MFDSYVYKDGSLKNVEENGKVIGFEFETLIPYYRGVPLSLVRHLEVEVDGVKFDKSDLRFGIDGEDFFTMSELETVYDYKWEYGEPGIVRVMKDGGLSKGAHRVKLFIGVEVFYIPFPSAGSRTVEDEIA